ncbi:hypothetical protein [Cellulomonas hominis]
MQASAALSVNWQETAGDAEAIVADYAGRTGTTILFHTATVLSALAVLVAVAALRHGAAPRWIGAVSAVLGGLTLLAGLSPLQYMAGFVGAVWLVVVALGFALGDRRRVLGAEALPRDHCPICSLPCPSGPTVST